MGRRFPFPSPTSTPTHHPSHPSSLPLLPASGCFKLSGKWAIKQNGTGLRGACWCWGKTYGALSYVLSSEKTGIIPNSWERFGYNQRFFLISRFKWLHKVRCVGSLREKHLAQRRAGGLGCWLLARSSPCCACWAVRGCAPERPRGWSLPLCPSSPRENRSPPKACQVRRQRVYWNAFKLIKFQIIYMG